MLTHRDDTFRADSAELPPPRCQGCRLHAPELDEAGLCEACATEPDAD